MSLLLGCVGRFALWLRESEWIVWSKMDIHSTFETLAEAWVAASTPTAVNPEPKVSLRLVEVVRICVWRVSWKRKARLHQFDARQISNFAFLLCTLFERYDGSLGILSVAKATRDDSSLAVLSVYCMPRSCQECDREERNRGLYRIRSTSSVCACVGVAATGIFSTGNPEHLSRLYTSVL